MPVFLKRPSVRDASGLNVQGWVADDPTGSKGETYQPITCTICTRLHLVDPKTGRVLGADEDYDGHALQQICIDLLPI